MTRSSLLTCTMMLLASPALSFDPGSDDTDGDLDLTGRTGTVVFDPVALGIDSDGDNVFHFGDVNIPSGVTLRLRDDLTPGPVYWLASGDVDIDGVLDLSGQDGIATGSSAERALPGPGGTYGGLQSTVSRLQEPLGPSSVFFGSGAGAFMGRHLVPLTGGVGGRGSTSSQGGAGGGAILIAFAGTLTLDGTIDASGGLRGTSASGGNGAVRLVGPKVDGSGTVTAGSSTTTRCQTPSGGTGTTASGGVLLRVETSNYAFTGTTPKGYACDYHVDGSDRNTTYRGPFIVPLDDDVPLLPPGGTARPLIEITEIDGDAVTQPSAFDWSSPDVTILNSSDSTVVVETENIPEDVPVRVQVACQSGTTDSDLTLGLIGTFGSASDDVDVNVAAGECEVTATAEW